MVMGMDDFAADRASKKRARDDDDYDDELPIDRSIVMGMDDFAADRALTQQPPTESKKRARDDDDYDDELLLFAPPSKQSTRDHHQDHPQFTGEDSDGSTIVKQDDHDDDEDDLSLDFLLHSPPCTEDDDDEPPLAFNVMGFGEEVKKILQQDYQETSSSSSMLQHRCLWLRNQILESF